MALLDLNYTTLENFGVTDGKLHEVRWEMRIGQQGNLPGRVRLWLDGQMAGESTTTGNNNRLENGNWTGTDNGGFGAFYGTSICSGESIEAWPYTIGSSLLYLYGSGFKVNQGYVYEENAEVFNSAIQYTGSSLDSVTGGLTGTDNLGAVWFGRLRIGNEGFLKSGEITFGTRSDDGSALWIDLDQDGDFSREMDWRAMK